MQADHNFPPDSEAVDNRLKEIQDQLEQLRFQLTSQLHHEVEQLQGKKNQLLADIEQLEQQRQQSLARQLAPEIVQELRLSLRQYLSQEQIQGPTPGPLPGSPPATDQTYQAIAAIDSTLRSTLAGIEQDLVTYRASLSDQLSKMHTLEQQGEVLLDALVQRLREELRASLAPPTVSQTWTHLPSDPPPPVAPASPTPPPKSANARTRGVVIILLYSFLLSLYNVVVSMVSREYKLFNLVGPIGGVLSPSVGNSLLILFLRMVVVVPVLAMLSGALYPKMWTDVHRFLRSGDRDLWLKSIGSGFFLFVSQVFIYIAFGSRLSPGVVITIFFIFPVVTLLLSWYVFGERPTPWRTSSALVILGGVLLISLPMGSLGNANFSIGGVMTAIASGVTFALYVILTQASLKGGKIHPVPFSLINFSVIFIFSLVSLLILPLLAVPPTWQVAFNPSDMSQLLIFTVILGFLTLTSYLLNNIGIGMIGAALASIFGATGPVFTSLLAWIIVGRSLSPQQMLGMLVVVVGVTALSLEKILQVPKPASAKSSG